MCHQESFANASFMAINRVVLDDEHGISSYILSKKKPDQCERSGWLVSFGHKKVPFRLELC
jgi:hypothetical protein